MRLTRVLTACGLTLALAAHAVAAPAKTTAKPVKRGLTPSKVLPSTRPIKSPTTPVTPVTPLPPVTTAHKHHHHTHTVEGVVTSVRRDKDDDSGSITIRLHHHHHHAKKGTTIVPSQKKVNGTQHEQTRTFHVNRHTKFEKLLEEGKGKVEREKATFGSVHDGEHVVIKVSEEKHHDAHEVEIIRHKEKKKVKF